MSRFWAGAESVSESEDEDSDKSKSDDEKDDKKKKQWAADSDSESEEENRKVVSAKDKTWITMEDDVKSIRNAIKTNDWRASSRPSTS